MSVLLFSLVAAAQDPAIDDELLDEELLEEEEELVPDVLVELDNATVTLFFGEPCHAVFVAEVTSEEDLEGATFWGIPFHPEKVLSEQELTKACDGVAIREAAVATKRTIERQYLFELNAVPVTGFLYKATEGYGLGTTLVAASKQVDPEEQEARDALERIGKQQRIMLSEAAGRSAEPGEGPFVRSISWSYAVRRFELEVVGPLPPEEEEPIEEPVDTDAAIIALLQSRPDVQQCIDKAARKTDKDPVPVKVKLGSGGKIRKVRVPGAPKSVKRCFRRVLKDPLKMEEWEAGAMAEKVKVPASP